MKVNEVEKLLSLPRSGIRFYEKEGLLAPSREKNGYREYSDEDVAMLKKILVLRKLGFSVEEISAMQKGELSLPDALEGDVARLEAEIESLQGALKMAKRLSGEKTSFEELDEDRYFEMIHQAETKGEKFADICRDTLQFELKAWDLMWKWVFFHDFEKSRKKHGGLIACGILLLCCILRGIGRVVFWHESFWSGFFYPLEIFFIASVILLPVFLLSKKAPKAANVIVTCIIVLGIGILALCGVLILYGVVREIFSQ